MNDGIFAHKRGDLKPQLDQVSFKLKNFSARFVRCIPDMTQMFKNKVRCIVCHRSILS